MSLLSEAPIRDNGTVLLKPGIAGCRIHTRVVRRCSPSAVVSTGGERAWWRYGRSSQRMRYSHGDFWEAEAQMRLNFNQCFACKNNWKDSKGWEKLCFLVDGMCFPACTSDVNLWVPIRRFYFKDSTSLPTLKPSLCCCSYQRRLVVMGCSLHSRCLHYDELELSWVLKTAIKMQKNNWKKWQWAIVQYHTRIRCQQHFSWRLTHRRKFIAAASVVTPMKIIRWSAGMGRPISWWSTPRVISFFI